MDWFLHSNEELTGIHENIMGQLVEYTSWKGTVRRLLERIRRIGRQSDFSVRQTKLLRKLINGQIREGYTDFEAVLQYFPGKTVEMLEAKYNEKFHDRKPAKYSRRF